MAKAKPVKHCDPMRGKTLTESFLSASHCGHINRMKSYLEQGADINARDMEEHTNVGVTGNTALLWSLFQGRRKNAEFLIKAGADVTLANFRDQDALHMADTKILPKIVAAGADVNKKDKQGNTVLMLAARSESQLFHKGPDHIAVLLDLGADPSIPAPDGKTVSEILAARARAYRKAGASPGAPRYETMEAEAYEALVQRVDKIVREKKAAELSAAVKGATRLGNDVAPAPRVKFKPKP